MLLLRCSIIAACLLFVIGDSGMIFQINSYIFIKFARCMVEQDYYRLIPKFKLHFCTPSRLILFSKPRSLHCAKTDILFQRVHLNYISCFSSTLVSNPSISSKRYFIFNCSFLSIYLTHYLQQMNVHISFA